MTRMDVNELRAGLSDALNRSGFGGERIIVERRGKPVAALVPVSDIEQLEQRGVDDAQPPRGKR